MKLFETSLWPVLPGKACPNRLCQFHCQTNPQMFHVSPDTSAGCASLAHLTGNLQSAQIAQDARSRRHMHHFSWRKESVVPVLFWEDIFQLFTLHFLRHTDRNVFAWTYVRARTYYWDCCCWIIYVELPLMPKYVVNSGQYHCISSKARVAHALKLPLQLLEFKGLRLMTKKNQAFKLTRPQSTKGWIMLNHCQAHSTGVILSFGFLWNLHIWDSTLTQIANLSYLISKGWIIMLRLSVTVTTVLTGATTCESNHFLMRDQAFLVYWSSSAFSDLIPSLSASRDTCCRYSTQVGSTTRGICSSSQSQKRSLTGLDIVSPRKYLLRHETCLVWVAELILDIQNWLQNFKTWVELSATLLIAAVAEQAHWLMSWQPTSSSQLHCSSRPMARQYCPWMAFDAATRCAPAGSSGFLLFMGVVWIGLVPQDALPAFLTKGKNCFLQAVKKSKSKLPHAFFVNQEFGRFAKFACLPLLDNNAPLVPREDLMVCESRQRSLLQKAAECVCFGCFGFTHDILI